MGSSYEVEFHLEEKAMYEPRKILAWIAANVEGMRLSRCKTLASIVSAALLMRGVVVLARLGRAMSGGIFSRDLGI